jgi:hypothetical protein
VQGPSTEPFPGLKTSADASSLFGLNPSKPLASALAGLGAYLDQLSHRSPHR